MAFGPIMRFAVERDDEALTIELAPLTKEAMAEFIDAKHGGGMQRFTVGRYMGRGGAPVLEDEHEWYERVRQEKDSLIWGIWVITDEGRLLIGNSAIVDIGQEGHSGFIRQATTGSMIFNKEYWGKGIASAAHKARTWFAFQHLGLHRLKSAVIQANGGSRKALERSGYQLVYTERNEQYSGGQLEHMDCLECLNPLDLFWSQWWHGDRPSRATQAARRRTKEAMAWAEQFVELL